MQNLWPEFSHITDSTATYISNAWLGYDLLYYVIYELGPQWNNTKGLDCLKVLDEGVFRDPTVDKIAVINTIVPVSLFNFINIITLHGIHTELASLILNKKLP